MLKINFSFPGQRHQVAVKCLSKERMQNNTLEFMKEYEIMQSIDHANIVRLYGVVVGEASQIMLVAELAPLRSLLECLKELSLRSTFNVPCLAEFAKQVRGENI
jgi:activated CDC42 kinase 1